MRRAAESAAKVGRSLDDGGRGANQNGRETARRRAARVGKHYIVIAAIGELRIRNREHRSRGAENSWTVSQWVAIEVPLDTG